MTERSFAGIRERRQYDRSRLFDKNVVPEPLTSMRDVTWEHQAVAMKAGYKSVSDMAIDELLDLCGKLEARIVALEGSEGCELVEGDD